jgi:hypothetical protein
MMGKQTDMLQIRRGTQLRFIDENEGAATDGLFIGIDANSDYVVVPLSAVLERKQAGDRLHARCMIQGEMIEFRSVIVEIIPSPVTLWRIGAPTDVNQFDLRQNKRIQCTVPASIEAIHKGLVLTGIIQDISKSGARCLFPLSDAGKGAFEKNEKIILRCTFPGIPGEQTAVATVTEAVEQEPDLSIAIQFEAPAWWIPPYH